MIRGGASPPAGGPRRTLTFSEKNGGTVLELTQTGVPDEEKERTEKGWKGLLLDRIKAMLGGSVLK